MCVVYFDCADTCTRQGKLCAGVGNGARIVGGKPSRHAWESDIDIAACSKTVHINGRALTRVDQNGRGPFNDNLDGACSKRPVASGIAECVIPKGQCIYAGFKVEPGQGVFELGDPFAGQIVS